MRTRLTAMTVAALVGGALLIPQTAIADNSTLPIDGTVCAMGAGRIVSAESLLTPVQMGGGCDTTSTVVSYRDGEVTIPPSGEEVALDVEEEEGGVQLVSRAPQRWLP